MISQSTLRLAYNRACEAHDMLSDKDLPTMEHQLLRDLSAVTSEAIDCFMHNKSLPRGRMMKLGRYLQHDSKSALLKVGYSVTILLNALLADRLGCPQVLDASTRGPEERNRGTFRDVKEEPIDFEELEQSGTFDQASTSNGWHDGESSEAPSREVKEELVEVKEEPLNEDDVLIKQEEPEADFYCPTTGTARPPEHSDFFPETNSSVPARNRDRSFVPSERKAPAWRPPVKPHMNLNDVVCYLCNNYTRSFYTCPAVEGREDFLQRVIVHSEREKLSMMALRATKREVNFCLKHIVPRALKKTLQSGMEVPSTSSQHTVNGIPLIGMGAVGMRRTVPANKNVRNNDEFRLESWLGSMSESPSSSLTDGPLTRAISEQGSKKTGTYCDLCDAPVHPISVCPKDVLKYREFFSNLAQLDKKQLQKVRWFYKNLHRQAHVCQRHFKQHGMSYRSYSEESPIMLTQTTNVLLKPPSPTAKAAKLNSLGMKRLRDQGSAILGAREKSARLKQKNDAAMEQKEGISQPKDEAAPILSYADADQEIKSETVEEIGPL